MDMCVRILCLCVCLHTCAYIHLFITLPCNILSKSIRTSLCRCLLWYLPVAVLSALVVAFYCGFAFRNWWWCPSLCVRMFVCVRVCACGNVLLLNWNCNTNCVCSTQVACPCPFFLALFLHCPTVCVSVWRPFDRRRCEKYHFMVLLSLCVCACVFMCVCVLALRVALNAFFDWFLFASYPHFCHTLLLSFAARVKHS